MPSETGDLAVSPQRAGISTGTTPTTPTINFFDRLVAVGVELSLQGKTSSKSRSEVHFLLLSDVSRQYVSCGSIEIGRPAKPHARDDKGRGVTSGTLLGILSWH
jgi:outer membrane lipoprotein SlyB